jgi:adenylate kinase
MSTSNVVVNQSELKTLIEMETTKILMENRDELTILLKENQKKIYDVVDKNTRRLTD